MLCQKCQKRHATIHLKQIWGNENIEMHLCNTCATEHSSELSGVSFDNFFLGVVNSFFKDIGKLQEAPIAADTYKCDSCGLTYDDFRKYGRLGCSSCYLAFRSQLSAIFDNVQGASEHRGKLPQRAGSDILHEKRLKALKSELTKAIEREEYEAAARIRDEIKALKGDG
ncbi:MAG: UvrB/UvrC motif-containing protein [Defluviitaleaceae bacterium]|nr:UvrB/UvrC motif-containing protein [Defluviitaleaceae bacterium]